MSRCSVFRASRIAFRCAMVRERDRAHQMASTGVMGSSQHNCGNNMSSLIGGKMLNFGMEAIFI